MFERYSEKARRTIFYARYESSQYGGPYIETEHLLLGLLREDKALVHRLLPPNAGQQIRNDVERHTVVREKVATSVDLPLSNECKRALAYAAEEAERLNHHIIGTEHLVLGLLREEHCFAATLLHQQGVTLAKAREDLQQHDPAPVHNVPHQRSGIQAIPFGISVPAVPVADLRVSAEFYKTLGFNDVYGDANDRFRLLSSAGGMLALYGPLLGEHLVCFTGGEFAAMLARVKRGELQVEQPAGDLEQSNFLLLRDPDGRLILLISPDLRTL